MITQMVSTLESKARQGIESAGGCMGHNSEGGDQGSHF